MSEWAIIWDARQAFLDGFLTTLLLFGLSVTVAFAMGCLFAFWLERRNPLTWILRGFIDCMRMLPFLILAYLLYYGLPSLGVRLDAWTAGLIALVIYYAAYFGEVLRGARIVLPEGQVEAAKAHGFTAFTLYRRIVLPQLVIKTRPLMGNLVILALKDTAFLTIITVRELTAAANSVQATYFIPMEAFVVVIALYWLISICLELTLKWAGRFGAKRGFEHV